MESLHQLLGEFPEKVDLDVEVTEQEDCGQFIRETVAYNVESGDRVSAYVCIPKGRSEPTPAIYCHHQHAGNFELGKSEVVGLAGDPDQAYAKELAERGFITFSPDAIAFEERNWNSPDSSEYFELSTRLVQGKTLMAKVLHDVSVGLDYLTSRPDVLESKIGFIGHSYGGRMALWVPAFDERVKASVSHCGCITYRHSMTHDTGIQMEFCIPGFMKHYDLEDVVGMFEDCALLISATTNDRWSRGYQEFFNNLEDRGHPMVQLKVYDGEHIFTVDMREFAYEFLERQLGLAE
jgi:dienelactone hydrolase